MTKLDPKVLYQAIKELALVSDSDLDNALATAQSSNKPFPAVLLDRELITDQHLGAIMADILKIPFVSLAGVSITDAVLKILPEAVAQKQKAIVFDSAEKGLKLAMNDPQNTELITFLQKKTSQPISIYFATEKDIEQTLSRYAENIQGAFEKLLGNASNSQAPITEIVDLIVKHAYDNRASDVHIEPEKTQSVIRFRIDGVLHDLLHLPLNLHDQIISRIKVAAKLKTDEHLSAQDGKMEMILTEENLDIRVSIVPIINGEKAVLRLLSSKSRRLTLADLGMRPGDLNKVKDSFTKPFGMVLATGPTGSGKTTTIYSILKILNTSQVNIATIEDPVEYDIAGINQIQVNPKTNLTFADGLRSILRQDPNIIFVGEIRDEETAGIAVNSATTGHLVLSTLHTNDAATTLLRLIDMGVEPYLIASTVNVIIGQRLVRRICEKCRLSHTINLTDLAKSVPEAVLKRLFGNKTELRAYQGKGCSVCTQTGFVGRLGLFEILVVSSEIKELITAKATSDKIKEKAVSLGMTTMLEDGLEKVAQGLTTIEEVLRATKE